MQSQAVQRPTGVTILAVLGFIGGILGILGSLALIGLGGVATAADAGTGTMAMILGVLNLGMAVASLVFGYGAWTLKPWAWTLGMGVQVASVLLSVLALVMGLSNITSVVVSIIIAGVIIYYLNTPGVKQAFGRA